MIRTALVIVLLASASRVTFGQCRPVVPEARELTSAGLVRISVYAERATFEPDAPRTLVGAWLDRVDPDIPARVLTASGSARAVAPIPVQEPLPPLNAQILGIWIRRDSTWTALRVEASDKQTGALSNVKAVGGPVYDPGTNLDVLAEWRLAGETGSHCSLLRSTVGSLLLTAPTVILRHSNVLDTTGVARNSGQLTIALRDADNPLSPITLKSFIGIDTTMSPGLDVGQVFKEQTTDVIRFDRLPARQIALSVLVARLQHFQALVDIVAGCETVIEVYLPPATQMHGPPKTPTHATVTSCTKKPERFGMNGQVLADR